MKTEKGQSLVEFALVLPVLLLILFGIVDFGRILHVYLTLDHAGREAARVASIGEQSDTKIKDVAEAQGGSIQLDRDKVLIVPSETDGGRTSGDTVSITISHDIDFLTPVISQIVGSFKLEDTTVMRVE